MYQIKSLELENVLCFKSVHIDFEQECNVLVLGKNNDDTGSRSNDSGKSALFDTISWINTGSLPRRKMPVSDIISHWSEKAFGKIVYVDNVGNELEVERYRTNSKWDFSFTGSNPDLTASQREEQFNALFGVNDLYAYFMMTCYFNFSQFKSFADPSMGSSDRLKLLEEMFRFDRLRKAGTISLNENKEHNTNIDLIDAKIDTIQELLKTLNIQTDEQVADQEKDLALIIEQGKKYKAQIEAINKQIKDLDTSLQDIQVKKQQAVALNQELTTLEAKLVNIQGRKDAGNDRIAELKQRKETESFIEQIEAVQAEITDLCLTLPEDYSIEDLDSKLRGLQQNINMVKQDMQKVDSELQLLNSTDVLECPHCFKDVQLSKDANGYSLIDISKDKIETEKAGYLKRVDELRGLLQKHETTYDRTQTLKKETAKIIETITGKEFELSQLKLQQENLVKIDDDIVSENNKVAILDAEREEVGTRIAAIKEQHSSNSLKTVLELELEWDDIAGQKQGIGINLTAATDKYNQAHREHGRITEELKAAKNNKELVKKNHEELTALNQKKKKLITSIEINKKLSKGFDTVRGSLLDLSIPKVEAFTNDYLTKLNTDIRVGFEYDPTKARDEFVLELLDGGVPSNYDMRGRGKRTRVAICTAYAIRKLYQNSGEKSFGYLFQDEVVDHMDDIGVSLMFNLLEKDITGQRFTISHTEELQNKFSKVLRVEKESGVSKVYWE